MLQSQLTRGRRLARSLKTSGCHAEQRRQRAEREFTWSECNSLKVGLGRTYDLSFGGLTWFSKSGHFEVHSRDSLLRYPLGNF